MSNKWATFVVFLSLNLLAAYAPAVLWVPGLPGSASAGQKFLGSPVLLALLVIWTPQSPGGLECRSRVLATPGVDLRATVSVEMGLGGAVPGHGLFSGARTIGGTDHQWH